MPLFDFTLNIHPEHMYCANCSTAIRGTLEILFKEKSLTCEDDLIATDFRNKKVEFSLDLPDKETAELLMKECKDRLLPMYETLSGSIETLDQKNIETKSLKPDQVSESHSLWSAFPLLGIGILLMLSEYFDCLPGNSTLTGTLINAGVGVGSTVLTGWFGRQHLKNAWRTRSSSSSGAMDSLIVLGSVAAIVYSFIKIFFSSFVGKDGMTFFDVPLITLGTVKLSHGIRDRVHQDIATEVDVIGESRNSLPKTVSVYLEEEKKISERNDHKIEESKLEKFFVSRVHKDSIICIPPLATVPIDGQVIESKKFSIHESYFGKKGPIPKQFNSVVFAGSINKSEYSLLLKTLCEPENNQIRKAYKSVQTTAAPANISLETVSKYFFRGVLGIATVSGGAWWIFGPSPAISNGFQVFLSDILSACPCGVGLINVGDSITKAQAIDTGILIQKDRALTIDQATDICIDKCGTLTTGDYSFSDIVTLDKNTHREQLIKLLYYAVALQHQIDKKFQSAPGKAIINSLNDGRWNMEFKELLTCTTFQDNPVNKGRGGFAIINGHEVVLGNKSLLRHHAILIDPKWEDLANLHTSRGLLPIFFAFDRQLKCLLILESKLETEQILRPDCLPAIQWLLHHNKSIHILTGDSRERTLVLMREFGDINVNVLADQSPQDKINFIKKLQDNQKIVVMIGDDENDLDPVRQANFGVGIDILAKVSREADVILNGSLKGLIQLMRLTKNNKLCYNLSLIGAFGFNSVGILTACGILYPLTKTLLHPMIPVVVMSTSSLCLIINIAVFKYLGIRAIKNIDRVLSKPVRNPLHHHQEDTCVSSKPINFFKIIGVLVMIVSYMTLFYNAAARDDGLDSSDLLKGKINWLYLTLTLLIGISQGIKIFGMGHTPHLDHKDLKDTWTQSRSEVTEVQPLPLSTASMASYLYPALGGADARNEGVDAPLSPPCEPPSRKESSLQREFLTEVQPLPLSTASMASYLYPALGGADARNEGVDAPLSPPCEPPSRKESSLQREFLTEVQPLPLSTASMASYLYPALGGADARNEGVDAPLSPPCEPPSRKESSLQRELLTEVLLPSSSFSINNNKRISKTHLSMEKIAIFGTMPLMLGGFGFGCYALWNQAQSFAQQNLAISISLLIPNLIRFILLPGRDLKVLMTNTEHKLKKGCLFILFSACHVVDSQLLANQIKNQSIVYWLSVLGLSGSIACYDVTHSVTIKTAYQNFKKLSCTQKTIALVLASLTGILHASQPFLGLLHLVKRSQPLAILGAQTIATTVKCITGSINAMQYVGMWATRSLSVPEVEEKQALNYYFMNT